MFTRTRSVLTALGAVSLAALTAAAPTVAHADDRYPLGPNFLNNAYFSLRSEVERGYKAAPVQLTFAPRNWTLVGLGSFLVNIAGGCSDCHTNPPFAPGGNPFLGQPKKINKAGYLAGGMHFGPFVSRNLTPENGLPAGRTLAEFKAEMRTGIDLDHAHPQMSPLLQVMPWPYYQDMSDYQLEAIYTYLASIPSISPAK